MSINYFVCCFTLVFIQKRNKGTSQCEVREVLKIRDPFEKFVDWWQCAAVLLRRPAPSPRTFQTALVH